MTGSKVGQQLSMLGLVGRVGWHIGKERVRPVRPVTLRQVPPAPESLTNAWLGLALCDGVDGAEVTGYTLGARNNGTSARRTLQVHYNEAGVAAGLPEALFTKSTPTFLTRVVGGGAGLSRVEAAFYALVRPTVDIEAPVGRYSAYDPVSHRQMLITDDVTVTRAASFGSALNRTLTREQAEQVVDTLAALHARYWQAPLQRMYGSWLETSLQVVETLNAAIGARARILSGFERARDVIPATVYARRAEVHPALMRSQRINVTVDPQTFLHGDVHPGNWYVAADGAMGLYDWQLAVQGGPGRDLVYALSTHLTVEQRRAWERDLLTRYLDRLEMDGVKPPPTFDELWLSYRQQVSYAMLAWLATIGRSALQPKYQPDEISLINIERITQAYEDLETLEAVGA